MFGWDLEVEILSFIFLICNFLCLNSLANPGKHELKCTY